MSDFEERERAAFAPDPSVKAREEEERVDIQLKEEIEKIHATMLAKKESPASSAPQRETKQSGDGGAGLDKEKPSSPKFINKKQLSSHKHLPEYGLFGLPHEIDMFRLSLIKISHPWPLPQTPLPLPRPRPPNPPPNQPSICGTLPRPRPPLCGIGICGTCNGDEDRG
ncbi:hypothetical protein Q3G72_006758 [Acer saccharum]|nr:hypothetical protein Q3G72_006758 [Acer saccharum]